VPNNEAELLELIGDVLALAAPGMGPLLGAEFIACTGGDMDAFGSSVRLAGVAGLAPVPRYSGRISSQ
jgi:transposase